LYKAAARWRAAGPAHLQQPHMGASTRYRRAKRTRGKEGSGKRAQNCHPPRSIALWQRPHVTAGKRYRMEEGEVEVESILPISLADITPELARASGFKGVVDLLKVAKHGRGENVYLVRFHYIPPAKAPERRRRTFDSR